MGVAAHTQKVQETFEVDMMTQSQPWPAGNVTDSSLETNASCTDVIPVT